MVKTRFFFFMYDLSIITDSNSSTKTKFCQMYDKLTKNGTSTRFCLDYTNDDRGLSSSSPPSIYISKFHTIAKKYLAQARKSRHKMAPLSLWKFSIHYLMLNFYAENSIASLCCVYSIDQSQFSQLKFFNQTKISHLSITHKLKNEKYKTSAAYGSKVK
jgi:hypothetical protein